MELLDELAAVIETGNYLRFLDAADELSLLAKVARVVEGGSLYRRVVSDQAIEERETAVLLPVATGIVASPATRWWSDAIARADQHLVHHHLGYGSPPPTAGDLHSEVGRRMPEQREADDPERAARGDSSPVADNGGLWWSRPEGAWWTTRSIPGLPAVGLLCFPDPHARLVAQYWSVELDARARVYEIVGAEDWQQLVARYPRDVTYSRRSAWSSLSDWTGPWSLPDWSAVAHDYDGVHCTVSGYFEAVGLVLPVNDGRTLLTGWGPDETFWLNDVIALEGDPVEWTETQEDYSALVIDPDGTY